MTTLYRFLSLLQTLPGPHPRFKINMLWTVKTFSWLDLTITSLDLKLSWLNSTINKPQVVLLKMTLTFSLSCRFSHIIPFLLLLACWLWQWRIALQGKEEGGWFIFLGYSVASTSFLGVLVNSCGAGCSEWYRDCQWRAQVSLALNGGYRLRWRWRLGVE